MTHIVVDQFAGHGRSDVPRLFSSTRDFRFHGAKGKLVHRTLPRGPKGYAVVAVVSTGHEASFLEQDRVALTIPLAGRSEVQVAGRTFVTKPGEIFAIGPSNRNSNLIPQSAAGHYRSYTIISPSRSAGIPGAESWLHRPDDRMYRRLKHVIEFAFGVFSDSQEVSAMRVALIEALIEDVFLETLTGPADGRVREPDAHRHDGLVRAAQDYMETHFEQPLSTSDIAGAVGVGTRTLQIAFRDRHGMTPKRLLTEVRLRAMHDRLTSPGPSTTVTSAAVDSGLLHFGRCSSVYRERYGELPSETLGRAKVSLLFRNTAKH